MEPGDTVKFESSQTNYTEGTIRKIEGDKVYVEYIHFDYAMGSTVRSPKVVDVNKDNVTVIDTSDDD